MKRLLLGVFIGLLLGWATVPFLSARIRIATDSSFVNDDDDYKAPHTYKGYLTQMLIAMKQVNAHLEQIELNTKAVKDKLHA